MSLSPGNPPLIHVLAVVTLVLAAVAALGPACKLPELGVAVARVRGWVQRYTGLLRTP